MRNVQYSTSSSTCLASQSHAVQSPSDLKEWATLLHIKVMMSMPEEAASPKVLLSWPTHKTSAVRVEATLIMCCTATFCADMLSVFKSASSLATSGDRGHKQTSRKLELFRTPRRHFVAPRGVEAVSKCSKL